MVLIEELGLGNILLKIILFLVLTRNCSTCFFNLGNLAPNYSFGLQKRIHINTLPHASLRQISVLIGQ